MKDLKDLPFGESKETGFSGLIKSTVQWLIEQGRDHEAIQLAWQAKKLGQSGVALQCLEMLRADSDARPEVTQFVLLDYFVYKKRDDRARRIVGQLLSQQHFKDSVGLRRVASELAKRSGRLAESIRYMEEALDLEYKNLPQVYDVSKVRQSYQQLFGLYSQLIKVVAVPGDQAPMKLVQRVIRSADRWRSLETDVTQVCQQAYSLLRDLGYDDLAWDYLTTPVALKPNEAAPWIAMANTLVSNRDYTLADKAYESAFATEKTNAKILWDHANMLKRAGNSSKAKMILRKLADGNWQRRFNGVKRDAERALGD